MRPIAIVTAASHGIGAGICPVLARAGWDVAVNYRSSREAALQVVQQVIDLGGRAIAVHADVTQEDDVVAMFRRVDSELGPISGLVNNAGGGKIVLGPDGARVADATAGHMHAIMALNVVSTMLCTREAVRRMSTEAGGKGGSIVNISSDCARRGGPTSRKNTAEGLVLYAAAKAAVDGFTLNAAVEVAPEGIRINAVRPATVMTPAHDVDGPGHYERMGRIIPMGRPGRPEEIGEVVLFLLSDRSSFVTGAFVDATGGR
jgi:NAD(P)-dependent dehydrogenase (short-subunit alcohol dehydrogenase family)